jgi:hypothetical protein
MEQTYHRTDTVYLADEWIRWRPPSSKPTSNRGARGKCDGFVPLDGAMRFVPR